MLADIGEPAARACQYSRLSADISSDLLTGRFDGAVLECVRYLKGSTDTLSADSPAFIVRLANRIAAGTPIEIGSGSASTLPLSPLVSPFATMKGEYGKYVCKPPENGKVPSPIKSEGVLLSASELRKIADGLAESLVNLSGAGINSILKALEQYLSYLPQNTIANAPRDISIFDHAKLRAALAACITEYCAEKGITESSPLTFRGSGQLFEY